MTYDATVAAVVPGAVCWAVIALVRRTSWASHLADHPNERSLHTRPTPRVGGIGIVLGAGSILALQPGALGITLGCALALACLSFADDLRGLPVAVRFAAHLVAAGVVVATLLGRPEGPAMGTLWVLALLAIAWTTNLFNFMDGADGLAGAMAMIGFGTCAVAASMGGDPALAWVCLALASAAAGFLVHNLPPARVFLGDSGSIPLGFLAASLGLHGWVAGTWPAAFPVLVFSPFIADATVTLVRRLARRQVPWRAHRDHFYQQLVLAGWSKRRLAYSAGALMAAAGASALFLPRAGAMLQCGIILAWSAAYALIFLAIDRKTRKMQSAP